jgi:hypothetical protein
MTTDQIARLSEDDLHSAAVRLGIDPALPRPAVVALVAAHLAGPRPDLPGLAPAPAGSAVPAAPPVRATDGLAIPERYGRTRVVALVQDPWHLFAYWEVTEEDRAAAAAAAGPDAMAVLVLGDEQRPVDLAAGSWYLAVAPGAEIALALGLRRTDGGVVVIARSRPVRMPPAGPSWRTDERWLVLDADGQWRDTGVADDAGAAPGDPESPAGSSSHRLQRRQALIDLLGAPVGSSELLTSR